MQFTKAEEYGMHGVLYLADKGAEFITPLSEISEAKQIPEKFLAKIFQSLSRSGIVRSHRGVRGGFTLAKKPEEITVKEVLESIQGPYVLFKCNRDTGPCSTEDFCAMQELVSIAEKRMLEVLEGHSLADLVKWQHNHAVSI